MAGILTRYEDESNPPDAGFSADYRLQWAMTAMTEGEQYLRNQPQFERIDETRDYLLGAKNTMRGVLGLSDIQVNDLLRIYNILSADMTDVRPFWNYESFNHRYQRQSAILTNAATAWYTRTGADGEVNLMVKQSLISGSGVLHPHWDRNTRDLRLVSWNPLDALPIRPTSSGSYQDCFAVVLRKETTVNAARKMFPRYASLLVADRDAALTGLGMRHRDRLRSKIRSVSPLEIVQAMEAIPNAKLGTLPVLDIFYLYVDDASVNTSRTEPILMGDWDRDPSTGNPVALNDWSYVVEPGQPKYPLKRLLVFTRKAVLYDGPSMYWHGMFPVTKFTPDPHPDLWFGLSPLWACLPLQYSIDKLYRAIDDHVQRVLSPHVIGDKNSISEPELRKFNPRLPGQRIRQNPQGKGVQVGEIPNLDEIIERHIDRLRNDMESISGAKNIASLMQKAQMPEGGTVEMMLRALTPENRARSRQLERSQIETGKMMMFNFMQFYTINRRFAQGGEQWVTPEDYDIDPDSIIPAYTNGDFRGDGTPADTRTIDPRPRMDRARIFGQQFALNIKAGSMMNSASQGRKMMVMMLRSKGDFPLYDTLKELDFDNLGPEPEGNLYERVQAEKMMAAMPVMPQMPGAGGGAPGGPESPGGAGGSPMGPGAKEGRPNTFQQPPHLQDDKIATS